MPMKFANNATTTLATGINTSATSIVVVTSTGALFPTLGATDYFYATLSDSPGNLEIVKVTARVSDTFTVVRAQDGTTAKVYAAGDKIELRVVRAAMDNLFKLDSDNTISGNNTFTGNLGVATSTPESKLDVNGAHIARGDTNGYVLFAPKYGTTPFGANYDRFEIRVDPGAGGATTIGNTNGGTGVARPLAFLANNSERMRIDTGGNVGIGTTSPTQKLHVDNGSIRFGNTITPLFVGRGSDLVVGGGAADWAARSESGNFLFATAGTERMRIDTGGNVGIGTSSPSSYGNSFTKSLSVFTTDQNATIGAYFQAGVAQYSFVNSGATNNGVATPLLFQTGGVERVRIDGSGNMTATGNVTAFSDERLKKNWTALPTDFVEQLADVKHGTYTRTDSGDRQVGVSAQSLQRLLPEAVQDGEYLSVAYGNAALAACVELAKRVVELESRLAALEVK